MDGDWGFVMLWAGKLIAKYNGKSYYPNFPGVMDIAREARWSSEDLFPKYDL